MVPASFYLFRLIDKNPKLQVRLLREAGVLAQFRHPKISLSLIVSQDGSLTVHPP